MSSNLSSAQILAQHAVNIGFFMFNVPINKKARNLCGDSGPFRYKEKKILHDRVWYFKNATVFVFGNGIFIVAVDNGTAIFFEYENGITGCR